MNEDDVKPLVNLARSMGLDPSLVLQWRMQFQRHVENRKPRPRGKLSAGEAKRKYGLTQKYYVKLCKVHGLQTKRDGNVVLIDEQELRKLMKRFPFRQDGPG